MLLKSMPEPDGVGLGLPLQNGSTVTQKITVKSCLGYNIKLFIALSLKTEVDVTVAKLGFIASPSNSTG